jgi:hypothetical protein
MNSFSCSVCESKDTRIVHRVFSSSFVDTLYSLSGEQLDNGEIFLGEHGDDLWFIECQDCAETQELSENPFSK